MNSHRRSFVFSWVGLAFFNFSPARALTGVLATHHDSLERRDAQARLRQIFGDLDAARLIGRTYLQYYPDDAECQTFLEEFLASKVWDRVDFRKKISAQRKRDFEDGDTVIVDGWVLARAEARACALATLI